MGLMSIGTRAMYAATVALDTTGHNLANATVDGYSRQRAEMTTATGQFSGAGFIGKGVDVATVTRSHDAFLTREAALSASLSSMDGARSEQLDRLERVFATGEAGIGYAANSFLNALVDVANRPGDIAARQVVLGRAADFAARLTAADGQIDALQRGVTEELGHQVAEVNNLAARLAQLNAQVTAAQGSGHAPNDLLDERDRLLQQLSSLVQVSTVAADDGSLSVFIAGGQRLVLGARAETLSVVPDAADPQRSAIAIADGAATRTLPSSLFAGGSIAGLLRFQNDDLVAARASLAQFGSSIATAVNDQQALGLDLQMQPGAPIFSADGRQVVLADPRGIAAASPVTATQAATNTGTATVASLQVVDPSIDPSLSATFTFADNDSDGNVDGYGWTLSDGSSGSAAWTAGTPLTLNGFELRIAGVPKAGDAMTVAQTAFPASNNGNAMALLALRDAGIVGGETVTDAWAAALAEVGVRVQGAQTAAGISATAAEAAKAARDNASGVNLDEEAARLIQYQQSYQAAAKILQVAQSVFDTLLDAART